MEVLTSLIGFLLITIIAGFLMLANIMKQILAELISLNVLKAQARF